MIPEDHVHASPGTTHRRPRPAALGRALAAIPAFGGTIAACALLVAASPATAEAAGTGGCFHSARFDQARARFESRFQRGQWEAVNGDASRALKQRDVGAEMKALVAVQLAESAVQRDAFSRSDPARVEDRLRRANADVSRAKDACLETRVRFLYAQAHYWQAFEGKTTWDEVRKELDGVLKSSEALGTPRRDLANALFYRGLVDQQAGTGDLGRKYLERSREIALQEKDEFLLSFLQRHLAVIEESHGNLAGAEVLYRRSLALRKELGAALYVPPAQAALADLLQKEKPNTPEVLQLYAVAAEGAARTRNNSMAVDLHAALRDRLAANGDRKGALYHAEKAVEFARDYGSATLVKATSAALERLTAER